MYGMQGTLQEAASPVMTLASSRRARVFNGIELGALWRAAVS